LAARQNRCAHFRCIVDIDTVARAVVTEKTSLRIGFPLNDKQLHCIHNLIDGRYVIGILPIAYGKTLIYTHNSYVAVLPLTDNIQNCSKIPDCLLGVVTQSTDSRLSETMTEPVNLLPLCLESVRQFIPVLSSHCSSIYVRKYSLLHNY